MNKSDERIGHAFIATIHRHSRVIVSAAALALALVSQSLAEGLQQQRSTMGEARHIVTQPARDVGITKHKVPASLRRVESRPYSITRVTTCARIKAEVGDLDDALGPDFGRKTTRRGSKVGTVARYGGTSVINSLIPFRGVIREVSGAAAADRRFAAAVNAGYARRGFLHGLYVARRCKPAL